MKRLLVLATVAFLVGFLMPTTALRAQIRSFLGSVYVTDGSQNLDFGPEAWDVVVPMPHDGVVDVFVYSRSAKFARILRLSSSTCNFAMPCLVTEPQ